MAGSTVGAKWKSEKTLQQSKREVPATLQPLDYTPTPKENIDLVQVAKRQSQCGRHIKARPHVLESLPASQQHNFVQAEKT
ncbi:hypothetical protein, variant [Phytophthora nicotianae CJ01A1]|uniref:Uncharacterized protein n=6 Tax=Phytophthora nicotianae TaxID=4792 RepID=W2Q2L4_PHYN3|nr:hypothetical protein, variant [Phytophthora nicotianae INRA-310]ETI44102.1 hypothetical protein, variant [Phytophthora nicotianae P1569]ETK84135.1 hypothetical protein, variant [Phytophthora nicotianae]ETO72802.1 hypothetical protein, variant [Phytophthora nicotianae P1976]ETP13915.1 hypothetical protein, variant [Phytophthora nicotianae CJ01A1]ETP41974.1 hypothetical protein, variant [Phytophthora nicotianae P10297]